MRAAACQSCRDQMGVKMSEGGVAMADVPQGEADICGEGGEVEAPTTFQPADDRFLEGHA
jgi:hypothetical protein